MKTTYLIYKQVDGTRQLVAATQEEWDAILKANRGLPMERRRLFEKNCFEDGAELDCMYIEVPYDEYKAWHRADKARGLKRKVNSEYSMLSLDAPVKETELNDLYEKVDSGYDLELVTSDKVLIDELRVALQKWKPWGVELLTQYLEGKSRTCTRELCEKYHVTDRTIQKRKIAFEKFVENYLKK